MKKSVLLCLPWEAEHEFGRRHLLQLAAAWLEWAELSLRESQACSQPDLARSQHPLNCSHPIKSQTSHQISRLSQTLSTPKILNRSHWSCAIDDDDDVSHHCDVFKVCSFYSCLSIQLFFFSLINKSDPKCSDFPTHLMISSAICYSPPKSPVSQTQLYFYWTQLHLIIWVRILMWMLMGNPGQDGNDSGATLWTNLQHIMQAMPPVRGVNL